MQQIVASRDFHIYIWLRFEVKEHVKLPHNSETFHYLNNQINYLEISLLRPTQRDWKPNSNQLG